MRRDPRKGSYRETRRRSAPATGDPRRTKWTLRDVRRCDRDVIRILVDDVANVTTVEWLHRGESHAAHVPTVPKRARVEEHKRVLDELIGRLGPTYALFKYFDDARDEAREARPKGTSEVANATAKADGKLHGGDGASQEVPDGQSEGGTNQTQIPAACAEPPDNTTGEGTSGAECVGGTGSSTHHPGTGTVAPGGMEPDAKASPPDLQAQIGCAPQPNPSPNLDDANVDTTSPEQDEGNDNNSPQPEGATLQGQTTMPQTSGAANTDAQTTNPTGTQNADGATCTQHTANAGDTGRAADEPMTQGIWGGWYLNDYEREYANPLVIRSWTNFLEEVVKTCVSTHGRASRRVDAAKLITELCAKRTNLQRARRHELYRKHAFLFIDVSGSCSAYCTEQHIAMEAIAMQTDKVHICLHSNGFLQEPRNEWETIDTWFTRYTASATPGLAMLFGDWDGAQATSGVIAHAAKRGAITVFMDNYGASAGPRVGGSRAERWKRLGFHLPDVYMSGIGAHGIEKWGKALLRALSR